MSSSNTSPAPHDKFELDFRELSISEPREGYGFQSLIAEIGRELGYRVERGGTGPDHGRDVLFFITCFGPHGKSYEQKWLVTCKDNSKSQKSVGRGDLATVYSDANAFHCDGLLLACSTHPTDDLTIHLRELESNIKCPMRTHIWAASDIKKLLHEREDSLRLLLIRYFPRSYGSISKPTQALTTELIELLGNVDVAQLIERVERLSASTHDSMLLYQLAKLIFEKTNDLERLHVLLRLWASISNKDFQTAVGSLIEQFLEKHYEQTLTEKAEKYAEDQLQNSNVTYMRVFEAFLELDNEAVSIDCRFETEFEHEYYDDNEGTSKTKTSYGSGQVIIVVTEDERLFSDFHISSDAFN